MGRLSWGPTLAVQMKASTGREKRKPNTCCDRGLYTTPVEDNTQTKYVGLVAAALLTDVGLVRISSNGQLLLPTDKNKYGMSCWEYKFGWHLVLGRENI